MGAKVKVGDIVVLNNNGVSQVFGTVNGLSHMKTLKMRITYVDKQSITFPEKVYPVEVDNPEINQYLIDDNCFDVVEG